jgi:hypothetical protein
MGQRLEVLEQVKQADFVLRHCSKGRGCSLPHQGGDCRQFAVQDQWDAQLPLAVLWLVAALRATLSQPDQAC